MNKTISPTPISKKKRLDLRVIELYPSLTRSAVQSFIMQGKVIVDGHVITKSGHQVDNEAVVEVRNETMPYVSRAGFKLEKALDFFGVDVQNLVCMDAGLSTGGFTDCLLQRGARKVYGVDVGYAQVHEKIRTDPRVVVMEKVNVRHLEQLPELVDLVTLDLSFISVLKVIQRVKDLLKNDGKLIVLIKPQFEAQREDVGARGVIKDPLVHQRVVDSVIQGIVQEGFVTHGCTDSPLLGAEGNKEFLAFFTRQG